MSKVSKALIEVIFEDLKDGLFIDESLEKNNIRRYDFEVFMDSNLKIKKEYLKILEIQKKHEYDIVKTKCLKGNYSKRMELEILKSEHKEKFSTDINIKAEVDLNSLTSSELDNKIQELLIKLSS